MTIRFNCIGCQTRIKVPDNCMGRMVKCPKCTTKQRAPESKTLSDDDPELLEQVDEAAMTGVFEYVDPDQSAAESSKTGTKTGSKTATKSSAKKSKRSDKPSSDMSKIAEENAASGGYVPKPNPVITPAGKGSRRIRQAGSAILSDSWGGARPSVPSEQISAGAAPLDAPPFAALNIAAILLRICAVGALILGVVEGLWLKQQETELLLVISHVGQRVAAGAGLWLLAELGALVRRMARHRVRW